MAAEMGMPAIMDDAIPPDMGRMNARSPWADAPGCSPAPTVAAGARQRCAAMYTLIGPARLNDVNPQAWLANVLSRIAGTPQSPLGELLPWNWDP